MFRNEILPVKERGVGLVLAGPGRAICFAGDEDHHWDATIHGSRGSSILLCAVTTCHCTPCSPQSGFPSAAPSFLRHLIRHSSQVELVCLSHPWLGLGGSWPTGDAKPASRDAGGHLQCGHRYVGAPHRPHSLEANGHRPNNPAGAADPKAPGRDALEHDRIQLQHFPALSTAFVGAEYRRCKAPNDLAEQVAGDHRALPERGSGKREQQRRLHCLAKTQCIPLGVSS